MNNNKATTEKKNYEPLIPLALLVIAFIALPGDLELVVGAVLGMVLFAALVGNDLKKYRAMLDAQKLDSESQRTFNAIIKRTSDD